jgi:hypothetical protein
VCVGGVCFLSLFFSFSFLPCGWPFGFLGWVGFAFPLLEEGGGVAGGWELREDETALSACVNCTYT